MVIKLKAKQSSTLGYTKDHIYTGVLSQDIIKVYNDNNRVQQVNIYNDWLESFDIIK